MYLCTMCMYSIHQQAVRHLVVDIQIDHQRMLRGVKLLYPHLKFKNGRMFRYVMLKSPT